MNRLNFLPRRCDERPTPHRNDKNWPRPFDTGHHEPYTLHACTPQRGHAAPTLNRAQHKAPPSTSIDRLSSEACLSHKDPSTHSLDRQAWGSGGAGEKEGQEGVTPNRFGRCTLRQHRVLLLPCVLQLSPSAYHSRDNCRRHEGAPLVGTRINYFRRTNRPSDHRVVIV